MTNRFTRETVAQQARIVEEPRAPTAVDRTFEIPTVLYGTTVALYLGFLALMAVGFASPGLVIPMAIFTVFIAAGFGIPAIWTRLAPETRSKALTYGQFAERGIQTHTGLLRPRDAAIQMLILPVLIVLWGAAVVTIAALS